MRNLKFFVTLMASSLLFLASCGTQSERIGIDSIENIDHIDMDGVFGAAYLVSGDQDDKSTTMLMLIYKDGSSKFIKMGAMDRGQIEWDSSGVFFVDGQNDYRITGNKLTLVNNPNIKYTNSLISYGNGEYIATYNEGIDGNKYRMPIIKHSISNASSEMYGMYVIGLSRCGNSVFGFANLFPDDPMVGRYSETFLGRIYNEGQYDDKDKIYFPGYLDGLSIVQGQSPCDTDIIYTISEYEENLNKELDKIYSDSLFIFPSDDKGSYISGEKGYASLLMIQHWDIGARSVKNVVLSNADSSPFRISEEMMRDAKISKNSLRGRSLIWLAYDSLFTTDVDTGVTIPLVEHIGHQDGYESRVSFDIIGDKAVVMHTPTLTGEGPIVSVIDINNGTLERTIIVKPKDKVLEDYYPVDLAINPSASK